MVISFEMHSFTDIWFVVFTGMLNFVDCFAVRFNTGPNVNAGGLEVHRDGKWYGICDKGFDKRAAMVACRSIRKDFIDATVIPGKSFDSMKYLREMFYIDNYILSQPGDILFNLAINIFTRLKVLESHSCSLIFVSTKLKRYFMIEFTVATLKLARLSFQRLLF